MLGTPSGVSRPFSKFGESKLVHQDDQIDKMCINIKVWFDFYANIISRVISLEYYTKAANGVIKIPWTNHRMSFSP